MALGPWLLNLFRSGATLKDFPKLAKYVGKLKVRLPTYIWMMHQNRLLQGAAQPEKTNRCKTLAGSA